MVTNPKTEQQYKVVYRGANSQWNYCSCFDFRTSQLGTCKHIEALKLTFGGRRKVHRELPPYSSVYIDYRQGRQVRIRIGCDNSEAFKMLANDYFDEHLALKPAAYAHFHENSMPGLDVTPMRCNMLLNAEKTLKGRHGLTLWSRKISTLCCTPASILIRLRA